MKSLFLLAICLTATYARPASRSDDTDHTNGRPGCQTVEELKLKFWRNNWDPVHYWECVTLNEDAVRRICDTGTLFMTSARGCVPVDDWEWVQPVRPPSIGNPDEGSGATNCPPCETTPETQTPPENPTPCPPCETTPETQTPPENPTPCPPCETTPETQTPPENPTPCPPCETTPETQTPPENPTPCPPCETTPETPTPPENPTPCPPCPDVGAPVCTRENYGILHPSASPTHFWQCTSASGPAVLMPCAPGTVFDVNLRLCNWP